jgi:hypothetical protein
MATQELQVRELQVNDLFSLAEIILKAGEKTQKQISEAIQATKGEGDKDTEHLGLTIIGVLLVDCKDDIKAWCGSVCGISPDEFGQASLKDLAAFIRGLKNQEGFKSFLAELRGIIPARLFG